MNISVFVVISNLVPLVDNTIMLASTYLAATIIGMLLIERESISRHGSLVWSLVATIATATALLHFTRASSSVQMTCVIGLVACHGLGSLRVMSFHQLDSFAEHERDIVVSLCAMVSWLIGLIVILIDYALSSIDSRGYLLVILLSSSICLALLYAPKVNTFV